MGADRTGGVSGLDARAWPAPSAAAAACLCSPLQPAATASRPGAGRSRGAGTGVGFDAYPPRRGQAPRSAGRSHPRVSRGRSLMNQGFGAPQAGTGSFGHDGLGGSMAFAHPELGLAFAYVMNQCQSYMEGDPRTMS